MIFPVEGLCDIEPLPIETFRFAESATFVLNRADIDQVVCYMGMTLTEKFAIHDQHSLVQGFRNVVVARIEMTIRQLRKRGRQVSARDV